MCSLDVNTAPDPKVFLSTKEWEVLSAYLELPYLAAFRRWQKSVLLL